MTKPQPPREVYKLLLSPEFDSTDLGCGQVHRDLLHATQITVTCSQGCEPLVEKEN